MKKKILIIIATIFCIGFFNINSVFADSMSISCDSNTLDVGDTVACKITGTTTVETRGVLGKLINNSNLSISNMTNISPYTGFGEISSDNSFAFASISSISARTMNLFSFNVTALSTGTGTLSLRNYVVGDNDNLGYTSTTGEDINVEPLDYNITISSGDDPQPPQPKSHDSSLASLTPEEGELTPPFTSDNYNYSMTLDFTSIRTISFVAEKNDSKATVGDTSCGLPNSTSVENVVCNIQVTAEDNTKSIYKITIHNSAYVPDPEPTGDIYINRLSFDVDAVLTPTFKKDVYDYEMSVNFSNIHEINFTTSVDDGVTVTGKKCTLPNTSNVESTMCTINIQKGTKNASYKIKVNNTYRPDVQCDMVIRSNVYTIDQDKLIIKVNSEHSLETIKSNLYSTCGAIQVFDDKVIIVDGTNSREYKLEKIIMPKTGNELIVYPVIIGGVLLIITICIFIKKYYFKKEQ